MVGWRDISVYSAASFLVCIGVLAAIPGCIYTVDLDVDADEHDVSVTIDGPEAVTVSPDSFAVNFEIDCSPEGCEDELYCRIHRADEPEETEPDFEPCSPEFEATHDDIGEGDYVAQTEVRLGDEPPSDETSTRVAFDFDAGIDSLDPDDSAPYSHPLLGVFPVDCTHPDCATDCQLVDEHGDDTDVDCSPGDPTPVEWQGDDAELPEELHLEFSACSNRLENNCLEETYHFERTAPRWDSVDAAVLSTCGILTDQTLWCWGNNEYRQLGVDAPDRDQIEQPHRITAPTHWADVAAGVEHTCGISDDAELYCWGENVGKAIDPDEPEDATVGVTLVDDRRNWRQVDTAYQHSCAVTDEHELYCWGEGAARLGSMDDDDRLVQVAPPVGFSEDFSGWQQVSVGQGHSCGIAEISQTSRAFCWGYVGHGRLGAGEISGVEKIDDRVEVELDTPSDIESISAGTDYTCAAAGPPGANPAVHCWGHAEHGKLGIGSPDEEEYSTPQRVDADTHLHQVSTTFKHTCALEHNGPNLYCWGNREAGQLGDGSVASDPVVVPAKVEFDGEFRSVSAAALHTCGITEDESLWCWGTNDNGQTGTGAEEPTPSPEPVQWRYFELFAD